MLYNNGMGKESKNLGITKACPECRKILIKSANIIGNGSFKTKCPHCKSLIEVQVGQKTFISLFKAIAVVVLIISVVQLFLISGLNTKFAYVLDKFNLDVNIK
jgi:phage FluMu protein Com